MKKKKLSLFLTLTIVLGTISLVLAAYTILPITDNAVEDTLPQISDNGDMTWVQYDGDDEIVVQESNGTITKLTNNFAIDETPRINAVGDIVWRGFSNTAIDYDIFYYKKSTGEIFNISPPDAPYPSLDFDDDPQINDFGDVVWWSNDDNDWEIWFYDGPPPGGVLTRITDNAVTDENARLNNMGDIVWKCRDSVDLDLEVCVRWYATGATEQISNNVLPDQQPWINDSAEIVWYGWDGPNINSGNFEIFYRDPATGLTSQLTTNGYDDLNPQINNAGKICWGADVTTTNSEIWCQDSPTSTPYNLSNNGNVDCCFVLSESGTVVWGQDEGSFGDLVEIWVHDGTTLTRLTNNALNDIWPSINSSDDIVWQFWDGTDHEILLADTGGGLCDGVVCPDVDGNPCTIDFCDENTGNCAVTPLNCDDGTACTDDTCDSATGNCINTPVICDDSNICTNDTCDDQDGCIYTNNSAPCDDLNPCTVMDICANGSCQPGGPKLCDDGAFCTGAETCNLVDGSCDSSGDPCQSPLPNGTLLTIDLGNGVGGAMCTAGSCFSMEVSPNFFLWTNISGLNGITIGVPQTATGSHSGPPNGSESPDIDNPWSFFGNTGMHQTTSSIVDLGSGQLDMTGWDVVWNGIASIPMGGDPANFPADTGIGSITVVGSSYTLDYEGHVPVGSPSGFGGVQYAIHLEGSVTPEPTPLNCNEGSDTCETVCVPQPELCDGIDNDCDDLIDEGLTQGTTCGVGACSGNTGTETCSAGTWVGNTCDPLGGATAEVCDNIDNDCDGQIDDNVTRNTTCGVGACSGNTGTETCTAGVWGGDTCDPLGGATAEVCDNIDNDCDGNTDEFLSRGTTCGVGACSGNTGTESCSAGNWVGDTCDPLAGATAEVCDNVDNDCDGTVDDGIPSTPTTCGVGECASTGTESCVGGVLVDSCTPGTPSAEICDGLDNDCNGTADDGIAPIPTTCGVGACASSGQEACVGGVLVDSCTPGTPSAEVCDNVDNDCDGATDENLTRGTNCGVGACSGNTGTETCTAGTWGNDTCDPLGGSSAETCNGIDDDCDGSTDENLTRGTTCGVGACSGNTGTETCTNGSWGGDTCDPLGGSSAETCNGIDDDCDGSTDENLTRGTTCGVGACSGNTGTETCTNGSWGGDTCDPLGGATAEVCDNIDNDCDGTTDDGLTRGTTCGVGACSGNTGTETCTAGTWGGDTCDPLGGATAEVCDNIDNDCDGQIDDNVTRGTTCGVGACSGNTGTETCTAGTWGGDTCDPTAGATAESCNNVDDDCDGATDENLTRGTTCGVGPCSGNTGTETCTAGTWGGDTCNPLGGATVEVCDNIDNDCDGATDENLTRGTTCGVGVCSGNTGTETCSAGTWGGDTCDPLGGATAEVCDNLDNDCDGATDENLTRGTTCGVGACSGNTGTETCTNGTWGGDTCNPLAGAGTEGPFGSSNCSDSIDNDCDGLTDAADGDCSNLCVDVVCPDDGNPCTTESCNPVNGTCSSANNTNPCDDGNGCTLNDVCANGTCQPGTPKNCNDSNICTDDSCESATGACINAPNTDPCDDNNACTLGDVCGGGSCQSGTPKNSDDGNICTDDSCDPATGTIINTPNTDPCDDNNACTLGDVCGGGSCQPGADKNCDDSNVCTDDSCDSATGACINAPNTGPCDDNNACTVGDVCSGGSCQSGTPNSCTDNDSCTDDTCDSLTGACTSIVNCNLPGCSTDPRCIACGGDCDDGNPCTDDSCDTGTDTCVYTPNSNPCDDGNLCTMNDTCDPADGICKGSVVTCNDMNPCTDDTCDAGLGCVFTPNTAPCDDMNACTTGDACSNGSCVPGGPTVCDDGDGCTTDSCDPFFGCQYTLDPTCCTTDADCIDDGLFCNGPETCDTVNGGCVSGPYPCDQGQPCDEVTDTCLCSGLPVKTIRGGGQRPTTTDLQIQMQFTVLGTGGIIESTASTVTVCPGTVLAFNCKVGNGPDPDYGELNGEPMAVDNLNIIVCEESVMVADTHSIYLTNKGNGGRDTDRIKILLPKKK